MCNILRYFLVFTLFLSNNCLAKENLVKKAHLNSNWYSNNKIELERDLEFYLEQAKTNFGATIKAKKIKALIAPHASFYYSGLCAASAYQNLLENNNKNSKIKNVIILSPSHTKNFQGIAIPEFDTYKTPLGNIDVNEKKLNQLSKSKVFKKITNVFDTEHSIEIQLPFLQKTIKDFKIIPLIVGNIKNSDYKNIAKNLKKIIGKNTLIVISTDFIHYGKKYEYTPFDKEILDLIRYTDSAVLEKIGKKSFKGFNTLLNKTGATICGKNCIKILLKILNIKPFDELEARLTCYYTSAQLSNARKANNINIQKLLSDLPDNKIKDSVSYASLIFAPKELKNLEKSNQLTDYEKKALVKTASRSIKNEFDNKKLPDYLIWPIKTKNLKKKNGIFVTLNKNGELRGCIGRIKPNKPLFKTIQEMAKAAAFQDNRFPKLKEEELDDIDITISILTPPKKIKNYKDIQLGQHGIILKKETKHPQITFKSVFLPKVPNDFDWDLEKTLEQLATKAGLTKEDWKNCDFKVFKSFEIK